MASLIVNMQQGADLGFTGPATGKPYKWNLAKDGIAVEVDEADVPGLLLLTYSQGCGCAGGSGNNEKIPYFRLP